MRPRPREAKRCESCMWSFVFLAIVPNQSIERESGCYALFPWGFGIQHDPSKVGYVIRYKIRTLDTLTSTKEPNLQDQLVGVPILLLQDFKRTMFR